MSLTDTDLRELQLAKSTLENTNFFIQVMNLVGTPIEKGLAMLPENISDLVNRAAKTAIFTALEFSINSLNDTSSKPSNFQHKLLCAASGGLGGFFGITTVLIELPVSTTLILRSIADIAHSQGENLNDPKAKLACIEVFALGGSSQHDNAVDSAYYAVRYTLAQAIADAAEYMAERGILQDSAPVILRFVMQVASRFGIVVSEKIAAQAIPVIGAIGGASINTLFVTHFQKMATAHFTIRRLERQYGEEVIRTAYDNCAYFTSEPTG